MAHALLLLSAPEGQVAEGLFHPFAEAADLDEAGLNGVPQAHADEKEDQDIVGEVLVDLCHDGEQYCFKLSHDNASFLNLCVCVGADIIRPYFMDTFGRRRAHNMCPYTDQREVISYP